MTVEWVDELPGRPPESRRKRYNPRGGSADLYEHAAALVAHPMRWARYPRELASPTMLRGVANAVRDGKIAAYNPDLGFEAVTRSGVLYVRHNPEMANPIDVAFLDGYRAGCRDTWEKVHKVVWEFRQNLAGLEERDG